MKNISKIYTYGTSFTKGGGFEFDYSHQKTALNDFYKKFTPNEERTQFNFSWPGQLQKYIREDGSKKFKVINRAKSGYGFERMIRKAMSDIKLEDSKNSLFLFEWPGLGRKEYWFRPLNDYIITNYHYDIEGNESENIQFVANNDDIYETVTHGIAKTYHEDSQDIINIISEHQETINKFNSLTIDFKERLNDMSIRIINFLSFLEYRKINYHIVSAPFLNGDNHMLYSFDNKEIKPNNDVCDIWRYVSKNNLTISEETNNLVQDGHGGYIANKGIAEYIYDYLKNNYKLDKRLF